MGGAGDHDMSRTGVALDGMVPLPDMVDLARRAEAAGVRSVWMAEHMGYRDAITASAACLAATSRLTVAPGAISVHVRHPMIAAMSAASLEEMAPGRTRLSVATGNPRALDEMGVGTPRAVATMREYVEAVRQLLRGEPVTYAGEVFRLRDCRLHAAPARAIPIHIAAMGPRMLELAGAVGDGVVLSAALAPAYVRRSLERVHAGARRAARDPGEVAAAGFVLASVSRDGLAGRRAAKRMLAYLFRNRFVAESLELTGSRIDRQAAADAAARGDWQTAERLVPDDEVTRCAIAGTPDECHGQLASFRETGLDEVVLLAFGDLESRRLAVDLAGNT
jgi:5,10-methylenetetrahydromethanopterin reductase